MKRLFILFALLLFAACATRNEADWRAAYDEVLGRYSGLEFFLHDMDDDGVPELFIVQIAAGIWSKAIYSFAEGEIIPIEGEFFAYFGIFAPVSEAGLLIQAYGQTTLKALENNRLITRMTLNQPFLPNDSPNYYIDQTPVTPAEFAQIYNNLVPQGNRGEINIRPEPVGEFPFPQE
ncbi:MAG: hypothetical protein LBE35_03375 [Clostridiales bacterium]|jgi:hypothetical protein|nr:hypothetical protein [Clostridiales bacterium]